MLGKIDPQLIIATSMESFMLCPCATLGFFRPFNRAVNSLARLAFFINDFVWIEEVAPQILNIVEDDLRLDATFVPFH